MEQASIKRYIRHMPIFWWTNKLAYIKFIARELTSVVVAGYTIVLLMYVMAIDQGPEAFEKVSNILKHPLSIVLHGIAFFVLLFHSITWFNLAPQAMVIKVASKKIPGVVIMLMNYAGWGIISIALCWFMLG